MSLTFYLKKRIQFTSFILPIFVYLPPLYRYTLYASHLSRNDLDIWGKMCLHFFCGANMTVKHNQKPWSTDGFWRADLTRYAWPFKPFLPTQLGQLCPVKKRCIAGEIFIATSAMLGRIFPLWLEFENLGVTADVPVIPVVTSLFFVSHSNAIHRTICFSTWPNWQLCSMYYPSNTY